MPARLMFVLLLLSGWPALAQTNEGGPPLGQLLKAPSFASAWRVMMAGEAAPDWVQDFGRTLDGPPTPSIPVPLLGETYTLAFTCKPNACETNQLYVLFAPEGRDAWGMLATNKDTTWLGRPEQQIQDAITGALGR